MDGGKEGRSKEEGGRRKEGRKKGGKAHSLQDDFGDSWWGKDQETDK